MSKIKLISVMTIFLALISTNFPHANAEVDATLQQLNNYQKKIEKNDEVNNVLYDLEMVYKNFRKIEKRSPQVDAEFISVFKKVKYLITLSCNKLYPTFKSTMDAQTKEAFDPELIYVNSSIALCAKRMILFKDIRFSKKSDNKMLKENYNNYKELFLDSSKKIHRLLKIFFEEDLSKQTTQGLFANVLNPLKTLEKLEGQYQEKQDIVTYERTLYLYRSLYVNAADKTLPFFMDDIKSKKSAAKSIDKVEHYEEMSEILMKVVGKLIFIKNKNIFPIKSKSKVLDNTLDKYSKQFISSCGILSKILDYKINNITGNSFLDYLELQELMDNIGFFIKTLRVTEDYLLSKNYQDDIDSTVAKLRELFIRIKMRIKFLGNDNNVNKPIINKVDEIDDIKYKDIIDNKISKLIDKMNEFEEEKDVDFELDDMFSDLYIPKEYWEKVFNYIQGLSVKDSDWDDYDKSDVATEALKFYVQEKIIENKPIKREDVGPMIKQRTSMKGYEVDLDKVFD